MPFLRVALFAHSDELLSPMPTGGKGLKWGFNKGGYRRLERQLGGDIWRVPSARRAVWGEQQRLAGADCHPNEGCAPPPPPAPTTAPAPTKRKPAHAFAAFVLGQAIPKQRNQKGRDTSWPSGNTVL